MAARRRERSTGATSMSLLVLATVDVPALAAFVRDQAARLAGRPYVLAIDGRSGAGKSTLAAQLAEVLGAAVVDGDGFFSGGVELRNDSARERARDCVSWQRQRPVLEALRAGQRASYLAFDWEAFDGRLEAAPTHVAPRAFVILEGVYSGRPELRDLVDLRVLLHVDDATRAARLIAREGAIGPWERQWHEAEAWYFANAAPASSFEVQILGRG